MAQIQRYSIYRHLRSEPSSHILYYRKGRLTKSGLGLTFWYPPLSSALAEIPIDDRDQTFIFNGRTADYQQVTAQGTITYRIVDPETLSKRVDFSIDVNNGSYIREPLEQMASLIAQLAQQFALKYIEQRPLRKVLEEGMEQIRLSIRDGLDEASSLETHGIKVVAVRISLVSPTTEMEKALQAPTREAIQQVADQATFERRALAVEKERAIAENELQNKIELAKREQKLIAQQGLNEQRRASEETEARRIKVNAAVEEVRLESAAEADSIQNIESARNQAEMERMSFYKDLPSSILFALAAQELASNLQSIEHLNLSPDALGSLLTNLMTAGTRKLEKGS